ncbi:hypothetical protein P691DRAFT_769566 [Macrolepiota fuliginosa MF-IS2]|uniref:Uncharacterized protein n=1 Tax=Macrolepiota fuliginosa MF-IS2 TaxID=1400762 RepID=A0A9P6BVG8_9AGAR|nr:hypothetical protein P691DRAFT_769566 [Macrolepiota fuliginosa MF-IS2]
MVCNPKALPSDANVLLHFVEFADVDFWFRQPPGCSSLDTVCMKDYGYTHYKNLPVVIRKDPPKGCSGIMRSINNHSWGGWILPLAKSRLLNV